MRISIRFERPTVSIQNGRADLAAHLVGEGLVEDREERLRAGRRQRRRGQDVDVEAEAVGGDARQGLAVRRPAG